MLPPTRTAQFLCARNRQGLRYVRSTPELFIPLLMITAVGTLSWEFQVTLPLMATKVFHGGSGADGTMASVMGVGAVIGGLSSAGPARDPAAMPCAWPRSAGASPSSLPRRSEVNLGFDSQAAARVNPVPLFGLPCLLVSEAR